MNQKVQNNIEEFDQKAVDAWAKCLAIIKDNVQWRSYQTWFEPIKAIELVDQTLTLQVPSQFFYEWLEEHYIDLLGKTIKRVLGREGKLEYSIVVVDLKNQNSKTNQTVKIPSNNETKADTKNNFVDLPLHVKDPFSIKNIYTIPGLKRTVIDPQLNPKFTFENYIEGDCNRVARSAGLHIAKKPGVTSFNPLVVFGGVGWGKTHLVQAIGNEIRKNHPNKTVLYVSADKFINQFIEHSKNNEINDFIHFYQLIDVLIVDDVEMFVNAPKSQEAFFAIFNHLHQSGKQIILTSDTAPKDLDGMNERLLSRFRWGLNTDIQSPEYETRQEILRLKMRQEGLDVSEDVIQYIAYNIQGNIRELEGAVIALFAQATLNRKDIDIELAKRVLKNTVKSAAKELTIENIQKMVCDYYSIPYEKLLVKTRKREIVEPRQVTMYLAKKFTKSSLKNIGEHFGGFDHTTVIHSCQIVENLMDTDTKFRQTINDLQQKVQLACL